ncbi:hypothetical protein C5167_044894 [Papaver somniferum]|uniref:Uncharacterized protein n=1 Tax=Papaver somniferum TaxID=3469 RepID=A0A4Y7LA40_PAPSO|nr:hypothetical protein C5167_044894 [Papaver somniferum]
MDMNSSNPDGIGPLIRILEFKDMYLVVPAERNFQDNIDEIKATPAQLKRDLGLYKKCQCQNGIKKRNMQKLPPLQSLHQTNTES